jgi:hypothetical protein
MVNLACRSLAMVNLALRKQAATGSRKADTVSHRNRSSRVTVSRRCRACHLATVSLRAGSLVSVSRPGRLGTVRSPGTVSLLRG